MAAPSPQLTRPIGETAHRHRHLRGRAEHRPRLSTPLVVWSGYSGRWRPILFLLPDNRTTTSIQSAIVGMADGQPGWYARFLTSNLGNLFHTTSGTQTAWVLALVSLIIGLGPTHRSAAPACFLLRRARVFAFILWIAVARDWSATSSPAAPPTRTPGRCIVLLAAAMVPKVDRRASGMALPSPPTDPGGAPRAVGRARHRRHRKRPWLSRRATPWPRPRAVSGGDERDGHGRERLPGAGAGNAASSPGSRSRRTTCRPVQNGLQISGLDLNNSPLMIMSGNPGASMDMNGADASAAAGFNTT